MPEEAAPRKPGPVGEEFAGLVQNLDLYIRQKTDLYIQDYLLDPLDFILKQVIYLSVVASLLVVGTVSIVVGIIFFISTLISLWAALLICGLAAVLVAVILAYFMFTRKLLMKTPKSVETAE